MSNARLAFQSQVQLKQPIKQASKQASNESINQSIVCLSLQIKGIVFSIFVKSFTRDRGGKNGKSRSSQKSWGDGKMPEFKAINLRIQK
jgi:hypothetical protein